MLLSLVTVTSHYGGGHRTPGIDRVSTTEAAERAANFVLYVNNICNKQLNTRISTYYLCICIQKVPRVSKRKQHVAKIAPLVVEGNKRRKDINVDHHVMHTPLEAHPPKSLTTNEKRVPFNELCSN